MCSVHVPIELKKKQKNNAKYNVSRAKTKQKTKTKNNMCWLVKPQQQREIIRQQNWKREKPATIFASMPTHCHLYWVSLLAISFDEFAFIALIVNTFEAICFAINTVNSF